MKKKSDAAQVHDAAAQKTVKGMDAVLTVTVRTVDGTVERQFHVPGYLGNTLAWQRSGNGLDEILAPALNRAFGGQVTPA